jgi:hypothetical protein
MGRDGLDGVVINEVGMVSVTLPADGNVTVAVIVTVGGGTIIVFDAITVE